MPQELTVSEYAKKCSVSVQAIRARIKGKLIRPIKKKVGYRVYYLIDIDKYPAVGPLKKNVGRKKSLNNE